MDEGANVNDTQASSDRGARRTDHFTDRTVFITGGTSGSGLRAAERFLEAGANVVINGRTRDRGEQASERLRAISPRVLFIQADGGQYDEIAAALDEAAAHFGGIDVLVSAGASEGASPKPFVEMTSSEVVSGLTTLFAARILPLHAALPHLRQRPGASAVLLTTDAGRSATTGESVIGAYAAAVIQMTKSLARELARERIRVNAVSMTLTEDTLTWDSIFASESFERKVFVKAAARFPFGAPPQAADVAAAIVFLASSAAEQITGQTLSVNGGLSFGGW